MEGRGIKPADLRPYNMATNSNIGQLLDSPGDRDFQGLRDELSIRQNINLAANAAQLAEVGYNLGENAVDIGARLKPDTFGGLAGKMAKAGPFVNVATNVAQGAFTMGSGQDVYGTGKKVGAEVIAMDLADSAPLVAGSAIAGPVGGAIGQTLFGGMASAKMMKHYAEKDRPALLDNPPQQMVFHRENRDHGRNQINQIWTGALNMAMQREQDAFDQRYAMHLNPKYVEQDQEVLKRLRSRHGRLVADYDDAMVDQNWLQKSYYAIRELFGDDEAFKDFIDHSKQNREEKDVMRAMADQNPYPARSRRALEATRYQSF